MVPPAARLTNAETLSTTSTTNLHFKLDSDKCIIITSSSAQTSRFGVRLQSANSDNLAISIVVSSLFCVFQATCKILIILDPWSRLHFHDDELRTRWMRECSVTAEPALAKYCCILIFFAMLTYYMAALRSLHRKATIIKRWYFSNHRVFSYTNNFSNTRICG
jgi:hypothetical protein